MINKKYILSKNVEESIEYEKQNICQSPSLQLQIQETRHISFSLTENVLLENKNVHSLIRIMNTVKILDSTFVPPFINVTCSWQKRMVKEFCLLTFPKVIESSVSDHKLDLTFRVLQLIESELQ